MKKILLSMGVLLANFAWAQFTTGTVSLPTASMTVKIDTTPTTVTLTLTGDSNSMLGIGFGSSGMASGADGFIYNSSGNTDYTFGGVGITPTADASQDWTVSSNTVSGSTRTIVATRTLAGGTGDFAISNANTSINIFYAKRAGNTALGYHNSTRDYATLTRSATLATSDLALENKKISIYPNPAKETANFKNADNIKSVDIYESTGRKVRTVKVEGGNISISDLRSGSYYLEITQKDGTLSYEKLIKE
ncbi:T9SS type A sorting domain-containing protein [Chryseobacterium geocarposphaerae]|uniref:Putative secreted protein (Por secretion system target) n=1 Tax=Chryseobacterium geocarposphaerae TaxID=1416776 RepID=A0A2M9CBC6_9FLAO|nr:T9SS type A sorting domain-containing protein [Chryseobacterium geocarposphaerae]PJJ68111.1 putative secreted protein (Por secretion system target) [Chryseobacterium geocarposphaerae]